MTNTRLQPINIIGLILTAAPGEKIQAIRVYEEGGSVQFWVQAAWGEKDSTEVMQYLTPQEAMSFAKAFERCAIEALKNSAE